jgi:uncharacterized lipoprotein NlpE involved in copper resistance
MPYTTYRPRSQYQVGEAVTGYCRSMGTAHYGVITEVIWPDYPGGFGWYYRMRCSDGRERLVEA